MKRRSAFELYVRTGRWVAEPVETKFNPWHDPDDGRFTFAGQGGYFGNGAPRSEGGTRRIATRSGSNAHVIAGSSMRSPATQAVTPPIRAQKPKPAPIPHLGARAKRSPSGKLRTSSASQTTRSVPAGTADQRSEAGSTGSLISTASNLKTAAANLKPGESRLVTVGDLKVV